MGLNWPMQRGKTRTNRADHSLVNTGCGSVREGKLPFAYSTVCPYLLFARAVGQPYALASLGFADFFAVFGIAQTRLVLFALKAKLACWAALCNLPKRLVCMQTIKKRQTVSNGMDAKGCIHCFLLIFLFWGFQPFFSWCRIMLGKMIRLSHRVYTTPIPSFFAVPSHHPRFS